MAACTGELSREELGAHAVDALPSRVALASLLGGSLFDSANLASLIGNLGTASGNADQTAPVVQGLSTTPNMPIL
jgi:hypothetical protein